MDMVIRFLTETLDGVTYIIVVVIAVILLFACIGYLAERSLYLGKNKARYAKAQQPISTPQEVSSPVVATPSMTNTAVRVPTASPVLSQSAPLENVAPIPEVLEPVIPGVVPIPSATDDHPETL